MNTITIKETQTHYLVEVEPDDLAHETLVLERDGETIGILLSKDDYQSFLAWQTRETRPAAAPVPADFNREIAAFERLKPTLQEQYGGRVVAIYQEKVVAIGDDKMDVLGEVIEKFGPILCYIERVDKSSPRSARIPSAWIAR